MPQECDEEDVSAGGGQRVEPELGVVGLCTPAVLVLRAVIDQQEDTGGGQAVEQTVQKCWVSASIQCRSSNTMMGCTWLSCSSRRLSASRALAALLGIEGMPLLVLDRHLQQRQEGRQRGLQGALEREQLAGDLLAPFARVVTASIPK